ncbi:MAG: outer-membrane lipoprotein carrier protein LolA [Paludibacteraceae bacterium]|nr:outer-membrane lipoprotein carrier protein LolA [Paludibacteraceae bacterium]
MYKIFLLFVNIIIAATCFAQTLGEPQGSVNAKSLAILNKISSTYKNSTGTQMELKIGFTDNKTGEKSTASGTLKTSGNKFNLTTNFAIMIFDGKTLDVYDKQTNELTISTPSDDEVSSIDPTAIMTMFKEGYKISEPQYDSANRNLVSINMYPEDRKSETSMITLTIDLSTNTPTTIKTFGKNGVDNVLELKKIEVNKTFDETVFQFNADKYKKLQIIDLR